MGKHSALGAWQTTRRESLDSLVLARQTIATNHSASAGIVGNVDRALYPVLAAEFQGFYRDLHGEAVVAIIDEAVWPTERLPVLAVAAMKEGRGLDRKNPASSVVGSDFRAFGLLLWHRIQESYPDAYPDWRKSLDTLVSIRNAVSHSDQERIDNFVVKKQLTFAYWKATRANLELLAIAMASAVRTYLVEIATPPTEVQNGADHD